MPQALLATGHAERIVVGGVQKTLVNLYSEPNLSDPTRPTMLLETPGTLIVGNVGAPVRGLWQHDDFANGDVIITAGAQIWRCPVVGGAPSLILGQALLNSATATPIDAAFNEQGQGIFLADGNLYWSDASATTFNLLNTYTNAGDHPTPTDWPNLLRAVGNLNPQPVTSVCSLNQMALFTFGNKFGYSNPGSFEQAGALNYYSMESSADKTRWVRALGADVVLAGSKTIELWMATGQIIGSSQGPFQRQRGRTLPIGGLGRSSTFITNETLFFVDSDVNVRAMQAGQAPVISPPWVQRLLNAAYVASGNDPFAIKALGYNADTHNFVAFNTALGCPVYDILTQQWAMRQSYPDLPWRWQYATQVDNQVFVGDAAGAFDILGDYPTERQPAAQQLGNVIQRKLSAILPLSGGRPDIPPIRIDGPKGIALSWADAPSNPLVRMRISKDGGTTFGDFRDRSLGALGEYKADAKKVVWRMNGQGRPPVVFLEFEKTDPTLPWSVTGITIGED